MTVLMTCEEELSLTAWLAWEVGILTAVVVLACLITWWANRE